eukprot:1160051-Pelagomonas_calceolata.AAC.3
MAHRLQACTSSEHVTVPCLLCSSKLRQQACCRHCRFSVASSGSRHAAGTAGAGAALIAQALAPSNMYTQLKLRAEVSCIGSESTSMMVYNKCAGKGLSHAQAMRATYQLNTEKLEYNYRVLVERDHENQVESAFPVLLVCIPALTLSAALPPFGQAP